MIVTAHSISRPIAHVMTTLKDIAEGDLTKEIAISSQDEMGDLARYLNFTVDKIKSLALSIRKELGALSQTGGALAGNVSEIASSVNKINATIQRIKSQTENQAASVKDASETMDAVVGDIDALNEQIQRRRSAWASRPPQSKRCWRISKV